MNKNKKNILNQVENLCYNLTLWKQDKNYQTGERMYDIQSDLDGIKSESLFYRPFWTIDFNKVFKKYPEFNILKLLDYNFINKYCIKYLIDGSEADVKFHIKKGGI